MISRFLLLTLVSLFLSPSLLAEPNPPEPVTPIPTVSEATRPWHVSPDGLVRVKILSVDPNASIAILEFRKGAEVPRHSHPEATEMLYVWEGRGHMTVGEAEYRIEPGMSVNIPQNVEHSFRAESDGRVLQVYAPSGPEQRFKQWRFESPDSGGGTGHET